MIATHLVSQSNLEERFEKFVEKGLPEKLDEEAAFKRYRELVALGPKPAELELVRQKAYQPWAHDLKKPGGMEDKRLVPIRQYRMLNASFLRRGRIIRDLCTLRPVLIWMHKRKIKKGNRKRSLRSSQV